MTFGRFPVSLKMTTFTPFFPSTACTRHAEPRTAKCADNVEMNLDPRGLSGKASVRRLEWDCAAELAMFEPPYDIVIAGDCLYEEACISPLLKTMWALSGPNTEVGHVFAVWWHVVALCVLVWQGGVR